MSNRPRMRGSYNGNGGGFNRNHRSNGFGTTVREDSGFAKFMEEAGDLHQMFKEFNDKMADRYRRYSNAESDIQKRYEELKGEAKALAEEKKKVAKLKAEAMASQAKAEEDLKEIRKERLELERASTDYAVQLAELTRVRREMGMEEPAPAMLALKQEETEDDDVPIAKRMKLTKKKDMSCSKLPIRIALQEDAPGLYELMEEKGLVDEMDMIANVWDDVWEQMEEGQENFDELGDVIKKLWPPTTGLLKDNKHRVQSTSAHKPNYCLPCLSSLIEQTRIFKQRDWPVKWGWCRPLQSFIFVFQSHNRIVLERPEYGFATYFFEIADGHSVKWQVERLIKVMSSVCNCRAALLENRPPKIGRDLLSQDAEVLRKYGWTPESGISLLLNFCDRVTHDYTSEDEADWRNKIGKLLMNGYDQGRLSKANAPAMLDAVAAGAGGAAAATGAAAAAAAAAIDAPGFSADDARKMIVARVKEEPC